MRNLIQIFVFPDYQTWQDHQRISETYQRRKASEAGQELSEEMARRRPRQRAATVWRWGRRATRERQLGRTARSWRPPPINRRIQLELFKPPVNDGVQNQSERPAQLEQPQPPHSQQPHEQQ